jgi:SAM-dependent methyltransferase
LNTLVCKDCEGRFQDIRYNDEQTAAIYRDYRNEAYIAQREHYEPEYREVDRWFSDRVPYMGEIDKLLEPYLSLPVSVLDWGGDTGKNAPLEGRRKLLHVYDIGNNPVIPGAVRVDRDEMLPCYDLIVCANVLEHVSYPAAVIAELAAKMDKDSVLYIEIPLENNGENWHEHVNIFTGTSLERLLDRFGIGIKEVTEVKLQITDFEVYQFLFACKRKDNHESN